MKVVYLVASAAILAASTANAQQFGSSLKEMAETPVVTVRSTESLKAKPDTARVDLGVETFAPTAVQALAQNAVKMERTLATLLRFGVPRSKIQTSQVRLYPRYDSRQNPTIDGYYARSSVRVSTQDLGRLGALLDSTAAPGSGIIHGPYFSLEDDESLRRRARTAALSRADAEANLIAKDRGFSSARVISIDAESYGRSGEIVVTGSRVSSPSTPIETGEVNISSSVTVRYILVR